MDKMMSTIGFDMVRDEKVLYICPFNLEQVYLYIYMCIWGEWDVIYSITQKLMN